MMKCSARNHTNGLFLQLLLLLVASPGRIVAEECSGSNPCATDPTNERPQFCNFDNGPDDGYCESCADHPDACASFGLPDAGTSDCEAQCTVRECSEDGPCSAAGEYFCNFDNGAGVGGFCEFCGWLVSSEDCSLQGLPEAGAASCIASCEVFGFGEEEEEPLCSTLEPCQDGLFCDFSLDDGATGHCWECEWHPHEFCFSESSGLSDAGAASCAATCVTQCHDEPGAVGFYTAGKEYDAVGLVGSPPVSGVSGPLIHCPGLLCGDDVDTTGGVCLIERGDHTFLVKVQSCEDRGGVAAVIFNNVLDEITPSLYGETIISSIFITKENGLLLLENATGSTASISLEQGEEVCTTGCSDLLPCPGERAFCNFDFETHGTCEECIDYGSEAANDCFFQGIPLRGAQECASICGSRLTFPECKFCPTDLSNAQLGSGLQEGEDVCEFCPGGLQKEYENQEVSMFGEGVDCFLVDEFYHNYQISKSEPNCKLAQTVNYLCGCEGIGYGGANTKSKQAALAWLPRATAILSFVCSAFIIVDVMREKKRRQKLFGQLMVGLSIFDLIGSASYALTSLPLPREDYIFGSLGNEASCTAQGFFIQVGTISSYMNVSLAVYYLLIIKYSWSEHRIKKWRVWLFSCPILVGAAFAFAGIPFYDNTILWCNNSSSYWSEIPLCIAIFLATCIMSSVCFDVYKSEKRSNRWRQGGTAPRSSLSKAVFWQSFWFTFAFYITWVPYLSLQFMWASGKAYSNYGFILFAGTACTMQGFWNFFVYMRPRTQRANFLSPIRSKLSGATSVFRSIRSSTRARSSARASSIPPVPPSDGRIETATELAGSTKNTAEVP